MTKDGRQAPSKAAFLAFAIAAGATATAAVGLAIANDGNKGAELPQQTPAAWTPADPAPTVDGLIPVESPVPEEGLVVDRVRLLPPGSVPGDAYSFQLRPGEQMRGWDPGVSDVDVQPGTFVFPQSPDWTVERGDGGMITTGESPRLVEEGVTIYHRDSAHPWMLSTGPILDGATIDEVMNERDGANFTYGTGGTTATVVDGSPATSTDRVWHVKLVIGDQWVSFVAPVVPFDDVARFIDALVEANS